MISRISKLLEMLFTRDKLATEISLHTAGATVRHKNPFDSLKVPRNRRELSKKFADRWIIPFYLSFPISNDELKLQLFANASNEINLKTTYKLLGYFNWRPRQTGAYFAAINNYHELEEVIGNLLLKSEVCYAGSAYCLALACFGTEKAKAYLEKYLDYYLQRKDLWFDQADAFCALELIDKNAAAKFLSSWNDFIEDKQSWNLEDSRQYFSSRIKSIKRIRELKTKLK